MDLTPDMLDELKCVECEKFLTCGPIYIRNTSGEAICGRCTASYKEEEGSGGDDNDNNKPPITRNKQYEIIARKLLFPCAHASNGCLDKIQFTDSKYNTHEQNCKYRDRICPVGKSGECDWIGPWTKLVDHCHSAHPNNICDNPCTLQHDITAESLDAYIVSAFNQLFILHVKVCVKTAKIYYSLRLLGNPKRASNFKYKLDVQRNDVIISKPGKVSPEGILTIQLNTSLALCVNSMLSFLGEYEGTTFTITVQKIEKPAADSSVVAASPKIEKPLYASCLKCAKETLSPYRVCVVCEELSTKKCARCPYKDDVKKCQMHERYFCLYQTCCFLCQEPTNVGLMQQHYAVKHSEVTHQTGIPFRISQGTKTILREYCLLSSRVGQLICFYSLNDEYFEIEIITPLPSDRLGKYQCLINITNPKSKHEKTFTLARSKIPNSDWLIKIVRSNVPANNRKFDIIVFFNEV